MKYKCPVCLKPLECGYVPQQSCPPSARGDCDFCPHNDSVNDVCDCEMSDYRVHIEMLNAEILELMNDLNHQRIIIKRLKSWELLAS